MNTMKTKRDMSFEIQHAVKSLGVSYREIAIAANVGASTISRAARHGYKVNRSTHLAIAQGIQSLMPTHAARCIATPVTDEYTPTSTLAEKLPDNHFLNTRFSPETVKLMLMPMDDTPPTATLAANLEKQVDALRDTITGSGLVDDAIESAHSREKAELQKALAARISEVQNLAADVAYEREKNATRAESIGQCFAEIHRLQDNLKDAQSVIAVQEKQIDLGLDENDRLKRLVALRTQDLSIYQKALEAADDRADDAEYKAAEFERDLTVQRAWTWFFLVLSFVAAVVGVVK